MVPRPARPSRRRPPVLVATLVGALLLACGEKAPQSEVPATPADAEELVPPSFQAGAQPHRSYRHLESRSER